MKFDMKTIWKFTAIACIAVSVTLLFWPWNAYRSSNDGDSIYVLAAAGMTGAIRQIADEYENASNKRVILNFNSSSRLAKQISAGVQADVFISANEKWMDYVCRRNLVDPSTRADIASTKLVLIGTKEVYEGSNGFVLDSDFAKDYSGRIAIGDCSNVPVGMYTEQALKNLGFWNDLEDNFVLGSKVSDVVKYVETGECSLGICYAASAVASEKVSVLYGFDEKTHDPVKFISAKCTGASSDADEFLAFLTDRTSKDILAANGFTTDSTVAYANIAGSSAITGAEIQAVILSVKVALVCVVVVLVPGICIGWILARKNFYGKNIFEAFVNLPLVIPPVVTGYLALLLLGKNGFLGRYLYDAFGISVAFTFKAAVVTSAIMGMPLLIRSVKTAMIMTDVRFEKAALTLGSSPAKVFFTITLPLALPGILSGVMLSFARSLGEFGATATFAGNIPGKTQTLSLAIHNLTQTPGGDAAALRLTLISVIISIVALICSEIVVRRSGIKGAVCRA